MELILVVVQKIRDWTNLIIQTKIAEGRYDEPAYCEDEWDYSTILAQIRELNKYTGQFKDWDLKQMEYELQVEMRRIYNKIGNDNYVQVHRWLVLDRAFYNKLWKMKEEMEK